MSSALVPNSIPSTPTDLADGVIPEIPPSAESPGDNGMGDYQRLQQRMLLATAVAAAITAPLTLWFFGWSSAGSLLIGSLSGLLYLRLLARSVSRLDGNNRSVGKSQLLVPVVLVLAATRLPHLEILPALAGFLLYKPAILVQSLLES